ncbi:MAG: hypothetical protein Kow0032_22940 [Methyloligellaceae bacterium]
MQQADRVGFGIIGAEGIGAYEFREPRALMRLRHPHGAHFMQDDRYSGIGNLPSGFGTGEAASDHMNVFNCCHDATIPKYSMPVNALWHIVVPVPLIYSMW